MSTLPPETTTPHSQAQVISAGSKVALPRPYSQFRSTEFVENTPKHHWYRDYYYVFDDTERGNDIVDLYYQHDGKQYELSYCQCNPIKEN